MSYFPGGAFLDIDMPRPYYGESQAELISQAERIRAQYWGQYRNVAWQTTDSSILDDLHRAAVGDDSDFARWVRLEFIPKARGRKGRAIEDPPESGREVEGTPSGIQGPFPTGGTFYPDKD